MARKSRNGGANNATNVQALDNLDLDDMFADGGDDLFDGLDIDLGNMDDITGGTSNAQSLLDEIKTKEESSQFVAEPPSPSSFDRELEEESPKTTITTRRKTKRKTTAPVFFEDQDDDFVDDAPVKRKRRTTKSATAKRRATAKRTSAEPQEEYKPPSAPVTTRKSKSKAAVDMPPPTTIVKSTPLPTEEGGGVIAAPQGRNKNQAASASKTLPKPIDVAAATVSISPVSSATTAAPKPAKPSLTASSSSNKLIPPLPGLNQSSFCGLLPSKFLFFPFLPSLPQEVAITPKHRKLYPILDRIHTLFGNQLGASSNSTKLANGVQQVQESELIFRLMQDAFRDEKSSSSGAAAESATTLSRAEIIGNAIGSLRKTIEVLDKTKLTQELLAVCALLKRQSDFLRQNSANMERWCRDNFSEDDYAEVYLTPVVKRKPETEEQVISSKSAILSFIPGTKVRLKVLCSGFKESSLGLEAAIPGKVGPASWPEIKKAARPSKKRKASPEEPKVTTGTATYIDTQFNAYAQLRPAKRRKAIADLISRTAYSLESEYLRRIEESRLIIAAREKRARECVEDQNYLVPHTAGMWKWLEEMGYFEDSIDEISLRERLEEARSMDWGTLQHEGNTIQLVTKGRGDHPISTVNAEAPSSYMDALLDLFVEEGECSDGNNDDEDETSDTYDDEIVASHELMAELTHLSPEERTYLQLRSVGLSSSGEMKPDKAIQVMVAGSNNLQGFGHPLGKPRGDSAVVDQSQDIEDIDIVINAMKKDLIDTTRLNHKRATYLETVVRATLETPRETKERKQFEASLHARHAVLVKRNKEFRAKNGQNKNATKHDDLALPW